MSVPSFLSSHFLEAYFACSRNTFFYPMRCNQIQFCYIFAKIQFNILGYKNGIFASDTSSTLQESLEYIVESYLLPKNSKLIVCR